MLKSAGVHYGLATLCCTHHIICIYTYHIILCIHTYSTYAHTCTYTQDYSEKSDGRVTEEKLEACTDWGVPA